MGGTLLAELEKAKRERKSDSLLIYSTGMVYAAQGKRAEALQVIKELEETVRREPEPGAMDRQNLCGLEREGAGLELVGTWLGSGSDWGSFMKTSRCGTRFAAMRALAICCGGWASRNKSDRR